MANTPEKTIYRQTRRCECPTCHCSSLWHLSLEIKSGNGRTVWDCEAVNADNPIEAIEFAVSKFRKHNADSSIVGIRVFRN